MASFHEHTPRLSDNRMSLESERTLSFEGQGEKDFDRGIDQAAPSAEDLPQEHVSEPAEGAAAERDGRDEEKAIRGPPKPVGFWHPALAATRKTVIAEWLRTVFIVCIAILTVLSIYWGSLFSVEDKLENLTIAVVDFDGQLTPYTDTTPIVGPAIISATEKLTQQPHHLGFVTKSPSDYNNDPMAVRLAVFDEHIWAAIIINANATALLQEAVRTGNSSYDPTGAAQMVYISARDQTVYNSYIVPVFQHLEIEIPSQFGSEWVPQVLSNTNLSMSTYSNSPQALSPAIGFTTIDLRPFGPATATPAITIGLVYLIILAFFSFSFFLPIHMKYIIPVGHPPMHFYQLIIWRWLATIAAYFFMSLIYSLVSLAFQIPFSYHAAASKVEVAQNPDAFYKGTFMVYWMLNFVGMCALGFPCENVAMILGMPYTALWLIFWVITNASTSFNAIPLANSFYKWGYAWPLHQLVYGSRTLLFGTHSKLGLNFGILFAWIAVSSALFPICCEYMRWKVKNAEMKKEGHRQSFKEMLKN